MRSLFLFTISLLITQANAALPEWKAFQKPALPITSFVGVTPSFENLQIYLSEAPKGVGIKAARSLEGGFGENVQIIDIETNFTPSHEDLGSVFQNDHEYLSGNHGTAVLGIMRGIENGLGVTGIAPKALMGFYGFPEGDLEEVNDAYLKGINDSITRAVAKLNPGDVLVIEQHMVGPDSGNYTAVEYWDEIFVELKKATDKGIHCVEAAGNGGSDFDSEVYKGAFDLKLRDSGCIMVGAGSLNSHDRLSFSNYGSRIDAHGYGQGVTTSGYGDLFNLGLESQYTSNFSGTSSATPIVAGAVALVSSIAKAKGITITPQEMRAALRATGTPQGSQTKSERIGKMPDVAALLKFLKLM